jgi:L-ascorbate metabolism protein UlaG (beta-lactamase superfamily)
MSGRCFPILGPLVLATAAAAQSPPLQIQFIGNEAVAVSDGRLLLVTDFPYQSGAFGYMRYEPSALDPAGRSVVLLITHRHDDHFDPRAVRDTSWRVLAPAEVARRLPSGLVLPLDTVVSVGGATVRPIATSHHNGAVEHYSYLVEWAGRRLYFVGDTEDPAALLAQRHLDVAFVSPWLWKAVRNRNARIDARQVVIYHHRTGETVPGCTGTCRVPSQGERWTLPI